MPSLRTRTTYANLKSREVAEHAIEQDIAIDASLTQTEADALYDPRGGGGVGGSGYPPQLGFMGWGQA